ncbi:MAG: hypothetical protein WAX14_14435 [Rhodococcus sp. (in: high G+C Gram-positive bacteria)]|uniref:hypothetical protein n=1 Tax=Rhodococcus sp. TaxID=1831 RepID=UPI003BB5B531
MALTGSDRRFLAWTAIFVVSQVNIARVAGSTAPTIGTIQTTFSAAKYRKILDNLEPEELQRYRQHYYWDMVHPLTFAFALRSGARSLADRRPMTPGTRRVLAVAPVIAAAGDYVENIAGLHLLDHRDRIDDTTVRAASTISVTKWVLALGCFTYLSQGFLRVWTRAGIRRLRG